MMRITAAGPGSNRAQRSAHLLVIASLLTASCVSFAPDREDPLARYPLKQYGSESGTADRSVAWWKSFQSPQLDKLVAEAFSGNLTLEQAAARLEQAAAAARRSSADLWPRLDGRGQASTTHRETAEGSTDTEEFLVGLYASYELDLWGRLRSARRASLASFEATAFDLQTATISLAAEIANSYFAWLTQQRMLRLYESQLESNRAKLVAMERRYRTGQATTLAVLQQQQQVAAAEARIPPVRERIVAAQTRIAVLTGRVPGQDLGLEVEPLPDLPPRPEAGVPLDLLQARPDLQSARLRLESADWSVSAARAARLPTLSLTGSLTTSGDAVDRLFDDWASNLAASLLAPLLDGGARKAEVDRTMAVARERIASYRLTVLEAIGEVEDALAGERHKTVYLAALERQYQAATRSEEESMRRYQRGLVSFVDALTTVVAREGLEISYVQAKADLLANRVQLYRALGGDFEFILEQKHE